ncbi:hypothetical protein [Flavobacterium sp. GP15]|uniref:hypothetical protein n=1 Tax=Flavobacterium sp. GP15 TaxID=2758567 RepID=UPI00165DA47D|nr:hypothetical protein [Flavobacterium sp. GP15]
MSFHKSIIIILLFKSLTSLGQYSAFLINNKYKKIDSLDLYRINRNSEIILLSTDKSINKIKIVSDWEKTLDRGLINKYIFDNSSKNGNEKYIFQFDVDSYSTIKILYCTDKTKTNIIVARLNNENLQLSRKIDTLFSNYDIKNIENSKIKEVDKIETIISNFAFKPFLWSEKVRIEFKDELMNNNNIDDQKMKDILNSYQIASGNNTGIGQILAMKDFILGGNKIEIIKWLWDKNITITNIEQLRGFIQCYDPVIDIINNTEFKE